MKFIIKLSTIFECPLSQAFKTPLLCDVSKVHTGMGLMPKVTHCTDDVHWGQIGATKKVFTDKSITQSGGFSSMDKISDRQENSFWRFEVYDFQSWMLGFYKFEGEWRTTEIRSNYILVEYSYILNSEGYFFYPFNYLFAKIFWKKYMKQVIENVRTMTKNNEPYLYK